MNLHAYLALSTCVALFAGCSSSGDDGEPASRGECAKVQEHAAKLRMASVRANSKLSKADLDKHQQNFATASVAYLDQCVANRSKGWVRCMLKLEDLRETTGCD